MYTLDASIFVRSLNPRAGVRGGDVKYPRLKLVGFLLHRPVPTVPMGLTESPQAFCVSASPAATLSLNRRKPSWSIFRAAFRSRS